MKRCRCYQQDGFSVGIAGINEGGLRCDDPVHVSHKPQKPDSWVSGGLESGTLGSAAS